jgi:hypothetical protein
MNRSKHSAFTTIGIWFGTLNLAMLIAACPGAKTVIEGKVRVDPEHCQESKDSMGDNVLLDCTAAEGSIRVEFPRAEWHSMRRGLVGSFDAGPGK